MTSLTKCSSDSVDRPHIMDYTASLFSTEVYSSLHRFTLNCRTSCDQTISDEETIVSLYSELSLTSAQRQDYSPGKHKEESHTK